MFRITLVSNEPPYFPDCFSYFSLHCFPSTFDTVEGVSGDVAALCDCDALQHLQLGGCAGGGGEFPQDLAEKADLEVDLAGTAVVPVVSFAVSQYPLTLITSRDLLGLDRLLTHEDAKTRNLTCVVEQQINRFQSWLMKGSFTDILQRHEVAFVSHRCKFFLFYFHTRGLFYTSEKTDDHHSDSSDHTTTLTSLASEPTDKP